MKLSCARVRTGKEHYISACMRSTGMQRAAGIGIGSKHTFKYISSHYTYSGKLATADALAKFCDQADTGSPNAAVVSRVRVAT